MFVCVFVWPTSWRGPPTQRLCTKRASAHSNSKGLGPSKNATRCHRCSPSLLWRGHIFAVVCWGSVIKVKDANRLHRLIRKAGPVVVGLCWSPWRRWRSREHPPPPIRIKNSNTAATRRDTGLLTLQINQIANYLHLRPHLCFFLKIWGDKLI